MDFVEKITEIVENALPDPSLFIVEIKAQLKGGRQKISIVADGDEGITIDQCAHLSRKVALVLEELDLIAEAYNLEVSSPGADQPIALPRQYLKNVGRNFAFTLTDGSTMEARLDEVNLPTLSVTPYREVKKKKTFDPLCQLDVSEIREAAVIVTFS